MQLLIVLIAALCLSVIRSIAATAIKGCGLNMTTSSVAVSVFGPTSISSGLPSGSFPTLSINGSNLAGVFPPGQATLFAMTASGFAIGTAPSGHLGMLPGSTTTSLASVFASLGVMISLPYSRSAAPVATTMVTVSTHPTNATTTSTAVMPISLNSTNLNASEPAPSTLIIRGPPFKKASDRIEPKGQTSIASKINFNSMMYAGMPIALISGGRNGPEGQPNPINQQVFSDDGTVEKHLFFTIGNPGDPLLPRGHDGDATDEELSGALADTP
ncbi:hypothetical protein LTR66_006670 [Elasticomyces elasticus]|nr:hypothetical protein LTR66_006670 [Elasticomyces elasticus]